MNDDCGKLYATVERKNRNQRGEVRLKFSCQLSVSPELGKAPYLILHTFFFSWSKEQVPLDVHLEMATAK